MSTDNLGSVLFGKARREVLALLFSRPGQWFYLREVARRAGSGLGAVQRELGRLSAAGIVERRQHGRQVFFRANARCPIFRELCGLVVKTAGIVDELTAALVPLAGRIRAAFMHGSFARGDQGPDSDVDVVIVGTVRFAEVVSALGRAQEKIGRDINPSVYPIREFRNKLAAGHHFLQAVLEEPKIFLIGDERELGRLAEKRLAGAAQDEQARDQGPARRGRARSGRLPGQRA